MDEIAAACEVSQRTFFRYFAGKEDAAFAVQEMTEAHFLAALRARPPHEAPMEALRQAVLQDWDSIRETVESAVPMELYLRTYRTIESTPALLAAHLRRSTAVEESLARLLAEREGVDVETDPRPRLAVAVFGGVIRGTERQWCSGRDCSLEAVRKLTVSYLDQVTSALRGNWRSA